MYRDLNRCLDARILVDIIYLDRANRFSKRCIRLISIDGEYVRAYCYARRSMRTFVISNILALQPVMRSAV